MKAVKKILVPTDFSDFSLAGLEYAVPLSALYDAKIYLLNILESDAVLVFHSADHQSETALRDRERTAVGILEQTIATRFCDAHNIVPVVRRGEPAREIVRYAAVEGIDLIVMATHGRTGLAHVLLGSVAEKVVRHARTPVLTVKPKAVSETLLNEEDLEEQLHLKL